MSTLEGHQAGARRCVAAGSSFSSRGVREQLLAKRLTQPRLTATAMCAVGRCAGSRKVNER